MRAFQRSMALSTIGNRHVELPPLPELPKAPDPLETLFNDLYEIDSDHLDDDIPLVLALKSSIDQQGQDEEEMLRQALEASRAPEDPFQIKGAGPSKLTPPPVEQPSMVVTTSFKQAQNGEPLVSDIKYDDINGLSTDKPTPLGPLEGNSKPGPTSESQPDPLHVTEESRFELNTSILPSGPSDNQLDAIKVPRQAQLAHSTITVSVAPSLSRDVSTLVHPLNLISLPALN